MAAFLKADPNNPTDFRSSDSSHLKPIHDSWFVGTSPEPFELDVLIGTVRKSLQNPGHSANRDLAAILSAGFGSLT